MSCRRGGETSGRAYGHQNREPADEAGDIHEALAEPARVTLGGQATCQRELRDAHSIFPGLGATGHAERLATELRI
jgi:hypothetical protein